MIIVRAQRASFSKNQGVNTKMSLTAKHYDRPGNTNQSKQHMQYYK